MSKHHRRAAAAEKRAAALLGSRRVHRSRYERAPDVVPVRLPTGDVLCPEVKTRRRIPSLVKRALKQAAGYMPDAIPIAVIAETGGELIACLALHHLSRLLGLVDGPKTAQLVLAPPASSALAEGKCHD